MFRLESLVVTKLKNMSVIALCLLVVACGESSPDEDTATVTLSGTAMKGVISQGIAQAYRIEEVEGKLQAQRAVGGATRTNDRGQFELRIPTTEDTSSLMIEVSSDTQTEMTCDDLSGCDTSDNSDRVAFGARFRLGTEFVLKAVLPQLDTGSRQRISVTPLSHLVVARAEGSSAGLTKTNIATSEAYIEEVMGLEEGDLQLEPADITRLDEYDTISKGRLTLSLLSAAFMNKVDGTTFTRIEQVLAAAATSVANTGSLAASSNNSEDSAVALDELYFNASQTANELAANSNDPGQQAMLSDINQEAEAAYQTYATPVDPVEISSQPQAMEASAGEAVVFAVTASGGGTLTYQWRLNGSPLNAPSSAELAVSDIQSTDQGIYDVVVSNNTGSLVSLGALLVVAEEEAANRAPIANDDSTTVQEDGSVSVNVLANDSDPDGDTIVISSVSTDVGTVAINNNNTISYQPAANQSGTVDVLYSISDSRGGIDSGTLRVTINALNDAPVARNDTATTLEDHPVTINVLANDSDVDSANLSISQASATNGSVIVNSSNTLSFVPATDIFGSAVINYSISDENGASDSAQVLVSILSANDAPIARNDNASTTEDIGLTINVLANDSDVDGDSLSLESVTANSGGTATLVGNQVRYSPTLNFSGTAELAYTVSDGQGGTDAATVTINVGVGNDAPVAVNDVASVEEDTDVVIDVLANDSDVDGDTLVITSATASQGSVSVTSRQQLLFTPDADFNGSATLDYTIQDGQGGSASAAVVVSISAVNDAPVGVDDQASTQEDTAVTVNVLANDSDVDGDVLTLSSVSANQGNAVLMNNQLRYTPASNFSGEVVVNYTFHDNQGEQATAQASITVVSQNDLPVAQNDSASTTEDSAVSINVLNNDSDVDGDTLSVTQASAQNGSVSVGSDQVLLYTPDANYFGSDTLSYTVSDGEGGNVVATVAITVTAVNDDPVAAADSATTDAATLVTINAMANDSDVDGDSLSISSAAASNGTVDVSAQGIVSYTPANGFDGTDTIFYSLNDGQGGSSTGTITVTVNAAQTVASIRLSWDIPTEREDGSALELYEIDGYVIAYGTSSGNLTETISLIGGGETEATIADLLAGTYYFAIATVDSDSVQGAFSSEIQQQIF